MIPVDKEKIKVKLALTIPTDVLICKHKINESNTKVSAHY